MFRVLTCLTTEHDWRLVVVAGVVCFLASLAAISVFRRARAASGRARAIWIVAAGATAGIGIWATHFIAMLAYDPGIPVAYNIGLTAFSLAAAAVVTGAGLSLAVHAGGRWGAPAGGAVVGGGIACMHYAGMWAVELPGRITWLPELVLVSIVLGTALGAAALTVAVRSDGPRATIGAAILLTLAIVSHHFTAMGAVEIVPDPTRIVAVLSLSPAALALAVASGAVAVLGISLVTAFADRRLGQQGLVLSIALNNMPQALCMFDAKGRLVVCNESYLRMYRMSPATARPGTSVRELLEQHFVNGIFTGDAEPYIANALNEIVSGKPVDKIIETADGRTIALSSRPLPGGGRVSTHEDISFRESVESLLKTVSDSTAAMKTTAAALSDSSSQTSQRAARAVGTSNEASTNVEAAADAANELLSSIAEIRRQLGQATHLIRSAVAEARSTNDEIARLAHSAQEIGDVVKLIQQVAGQTNLLALNATIEAARAGETGRGFAVVASEVKALAVQTAKATEQITAQIAAVQSSTKSAVEAIRRNTDRLQEIDRSASIVAGSLEQQNTATDEISRNVAGAAGATKAVVAVLDEVAGATSKTRGSAETVLSATQAVEAAAGQLREKVEGFLRQVAG